MKPKPEIGRHDDLWNMLFPDDSKRASPTGDGPRPQRGASTPRQDPPTPAPEGLPLLQQAWEDAIPLPDGLYTATLVEVQGPPELDDRVLLKWQVASKPGSPPCFCHQRVMLSSEAMRFFRRQVLLLGCSRPLFADSLVALRESVPTAVIRVSTRNGLENVSVVWLA